MLHALEYAIPISAAALFSNPVSSTSLHTAHRYLPQRRSVFFGVLGFDDGSTDLDFEIAGIHACSDLVVTILSNEESSLRAKLIYCSLPVENIFSIENN